MFPFVETLRIERGQVCNLEYHQRRMAATMGHFFPEATVPKLADELASRRWPSDRVWKVHVEYDGRGIGMVKADEYHMRTIRKLRLVGCDDIDYEYKSADRSRLMALAAERGDADEIVIVRQGLITDTSYSNIVLYDGRRWVTPRHPLLRGTMRQSLLDQGLLEERDIRASEWPGYQRASLINAMMPLGRCVVAIGR